MIVVVLHAHIPPDAPKDEQDALVQAAAVSDALRELGHEPRRLDFTLDLRGVARSLVESNVGFVFNLVETVDGAGRLIHLAPALLDHLKIPYTGNATEAMFTTSNKLVSKNTLAAGAIATPEWFVGEDSRQFCKGQYIVKSAWEHASIGLDEENIVEADKPETLVAAIIKFASKAPGQWYAERFVPGREFNISVVNGADGPRVMPPAKIDFSAFADDKPKIVGYRAKWVEGSFEFGNTPRGFDFPASDSKLLDDLIATTKKCWRAFGLNGYARVDFRVDESGKPWVLEINANPCISPDSGFVAATARGGFSYVELVKNITEHLNA